MSDYVILVCKIIVCIVPAVAATWGLTRPRDSKGRFVSIAKLSLYAAVVAAIFGIIQGVKEMQSEQAAAKREDMHQRQITSQISSTQKQLNDANQKLENTIKDSNDLKLQNDTLQSQGKILLTDIGQTKTQLDQAKLQTTDLIKQTADSLEVQSKSSKALASVSKSSLDLKKDMSQAKDTLTTVLGTAKAVEATGENILHTTGNIDAAVEADAAANAAAHNPLQINWLYARFYYSLDPNTRAQEYADEMRSHKIGGELQVGALSEVSLSHIGTDADYDPIVNPRFQLWFLKTDPNKLISKEPAIAEAKLNTSSDMRYFDIRLANSQHRPPIVLSIKANNSGEPSDLLEQEIYATNCPAAGGLQGALPSVNSLNSAYLVFATPQGYTAGSMYLCELQLCVGKDSGVINLTLPLSRFTSVTTQDGQTFSWAQLHISS